MEMPQVKKDISAQLRDNQPCGKAIYELGGIDEKHIFGFNVWV